MNFSKIKNIGVVRPPLPWDRARVRAGEGERVILLHGLWRSVTAMEPMARFLSARGYETVVLPYPSFRQGLPAIVESLNTQLEELALPDKKTHFVTHSLGGIVLRNWFAGTEKPNNSGRAVMLAPPSQGSEIIDWLEGGLLGRIFLGPAGMALSTSQLAAEFTALAELEIGILMGSFPSIPFFRTMLEAENDGIVSVSRGRMEEMKDFRVLPADHTFFAASEAAQKLTLRFLKEGNFGIEK